MKNREKEKHGALGVDNFNTLMRVDPATGVSIDCVTVTLSTKFHLITGDPRMQKIWNEKCAESLRGVFERVAFEVLQLYASEMVELEDVDYGRISN